MDYSDYPTSQTPRIPWKLIALVAGGVVIAVIIIVMAVGFGKKPVAQKNAGTVPVSTTGNTTATAPTPLKSVLIVCDHADDKVLCEQLATTQKAELTKDISLCAKLDDVHKQGCIYRVADAKQDETLCSQLTDQTEQAMCLSIVTYKHAVSILDPGLCAKITEYSVQLGCKTTILNSVTSANCADKIKDTTFCELVTVAERSAKAQDSALCDALKDYRVYMCKSYVPIDDPDFDGLTTYQEINIYHTDPRNPDTDGDGFSDGAEVKSGHDPLKK